MGNWQKNDENRLLWMILYDFGKQYMEYYWINRWLLILFDDYRDCWFSNIYLWQMII